MASRKTTPSTTRKTAPKKPRRAAAATAERHVAATDSLNAYIREISKLPPLTADEEKDLARRIQQGDHKALQRLVEGNLKFVVSYAKRYRGLGMPFIDLIHEGTLGLIEAAKRFDADRNVKFISYAVWWVRQAIFQVLSQNTRAFKLPQKLSGQVSKVGIARQKLSLELERPPTTEELAARTELSKEVIENLLQVAGEDLSLSTALGDGRLELGDTLQQESVPSVETTLMQSSFEDQIRKLLDDPTVLEPKEREVIRMRFGFDRDEERTLQEIGDILGVSRERVRQIESRAKEKLKRSTRAKLLKSELH